MDVLTWIDSKDKKTYKFFNCHHNNEILNRLMQFVTNLGGSIFTIGITVIMLFNSNYYDNALEGAFSLTVSHIIVQLLKNVCLRPRPYDAIKNANILCRPLKDFSFPSGHTTAAFALAISWSINFVYIAPFLYITATLVGLSRVYLGMHYPSDILIGALIGTVSAATCVYVI